MTDVYKFCMDNSKSKRVFIGNYQYFETIYSQNSYQVKKWFKITQKNNHAFLFDKN